MIPRMRHFVVPFFMAPSPRIPASPNGTHQDEHHNEDDGVLVSHTPTPEAGLSTADPIAIDSDDTSIEESPASDVTTDTSDNRVSKSFRRTRDEWQELRGMLEVRHCCPCWADRADD